ncbi:MAG: lysophospholipid acyltransferase family protein, partial [Acidimicrobiia bacterium]
HLKDLGAYLLVRIGAGLLGLLPAKAARRLGELAGRIWYLAGGDRKRLAGRHMERVVGSSGVARGLTPKVFQSYGRYWAETLWVRPRRIPGVDAGLEVVGLEHLRRAATEQAGAVIALPHLGNWEPAALAGQRVGIEIVAVAEKLANPWVTKWFTSLRKHFGITIVLAGRGSMRGIQAGIARGAAVCLLCDRDLSSRGITTEFFGEETTLPAGPARLVLRTGAPLLLGACFFTPNGHRLILQHLEVAPQSSPETVTAMIARGLESLIRQAPEQWHLLQPNWPSDRVRREVEPT